jgi:cephalosporin-C deacetylase-like acetyl esterase
MLKPYLLIGLFSAHTWVAQGAESLPPLQNGRAPQTYAQLWAGYDPTSEPLETEILKDWEEDGVILRVLRYRIGIFKGQTAAMAAVYGFPKGGTKLPALVQIHGGGQFADYRAPLTNAKRGYATISLAWAGRISAPGYSVGAKEVALFWAGKTDDPGYKVTTDWGALDAYHAPCRNPKNNFQTIAPAAWTLDAVESPRNNPWFLCTLAARRALTFLATQPEVDADKLGVYGHSMGGKLTVMTAAADRRVKAAAPSCGGVSDRYRLQNTLYKTTISDAENLRHITGPIIFLSPANDFHGRFADLQTALGEIASPTWRVASSPHHNHQDTAEYQVAGLLWFDQHLQDRFRYPQTPGVTLELETGTGSSAVSVAVDSSAPVSEVVVYYAAGDTEPDSSIGGSMQTRNRFWRQVRAKPGAKGWTAELPLFEVARPLWVYANVRYALAEPVTGAGYYYGVYTAKTFEVSSRLRVVAPAELAAARIRPVLKPTLTIERFEDRWQQDWYSYNTTGWEYRTHKVFDPQWAAPAGAALAVDVRNVTANTMVIRIDDYAAAVRLEGGAEWQRVRLRPSDFENAAGERMASWSGIRELSLSPGENLKVTVKGKQSKRPLGGTWHGPRPEFRQLRWEGIPADVTAR